MEDLPPEHLCAKCDQYAAQWKPAANKLWGCDGWYGIFPLETLRRKSGLQFAVLTRSAGVLPGDAVSLYFGCVRLNYPAYLAGIILGDAPGMAAATILGRQVSDPGSLGFWAAMGSGVAVALFSFLACGRVVRNHKTAPAPEQYKNET